MRGSGEEQRETIRPEFNPAIMIDFHGAKITSERVFCYCERIDERFGILGPIGSELAGTRFWVHSKHTQLQMVRQRVYQITAGYEDCNDADFLRIDPALRLAIGKGDEAGAGRPRLSRLENEVLGTEAVLTALEKALMRSNDALMKRKKKQRLILDVDSTEDPAHGKQEHVAFNGHFRKELLSSSDRFHERRRLFEG
jgi:hypothetical protein